MNVLGPVKAATAVSTSLSSSEVEAYRKAFAAYDKDGADKASGACFPAYQALSPAQTRRQRDHRHARAPDGAPGSGPHPH